VNGNSSAYALTQRFRIRAVLPGKVSGAAAHHILFVRVRRAASQRPCWFDQLSVSGGSGFTGEDSTQRSCSKKAKRI